MSQRMPRLARAFLLAAVAAGGALVMPGRAEAQSCTEEPCGPLDWQQPAITISPGTSTQAAGARSVSISWSDNYLLDASSRSITYDGVDVTGQFSYSGPNNWTASSSGSVTITPGTHTLTAAICDVYGPNCRQMSVTYTGPAPSVRVSPELATASMAGATPSAARFRVVNTGTALTTYTMITPCPSGFTGCTASVPTVVLAGGDSAWVDVGFTTPASGSGWIQLTAASGSVSSFGGTTVTALAEPDGGYLGDSKSLERIEREACVTIAIAPSAASECGDLRVTHALPSTRVLNKDRAPVLLYNSNAARPHPVVAEHLAGPATQPDTIRATLLLNGVQVATGKWVGWTPGQTRRIAVSFDASAYATGLHPYTLQVTAQYGATQQTIVNRTGRMVIVNRAASPFGAGWWLSGLEQLTTLPGDTLKLWVGGDGSARLYRGNPGGPWVADSYERPDTLYNGVEPYTGTTVTVRTLPGRAEIWFDQTGRHVRTINRLQHSTIFRWNGSYLTRVDLPYTAAQGSDTLRYAFEYNTNPTKPVQRLSRVVAPYATGSRYVWVTADTAGRVTRITDPDSAYVNFGYSTTTKWMSSRTDRRGNMASYGYLRVRLHSASQPLNGAETSLVRVQAAQTLGMNGTSVRSDSVHVIFDGARTEFCDCVWWKVDRYGAPTYMRDPYASITLVKRGDPRWPGRVTSTTAHNGFVTTATYDARGNLASATAVDPYGDGRNSTTTYEWDPVWDVPLRIVAPEGEVTLLGYDAYGRRSWEQPGTSSTRRMNYAYYDATHASAPGLVQSVTQPGGAAEQYEYDVRGNLNATVSPQGIRLERTLDRLGRTLVVRTPIDGVTFQYDSTFYNLIDQADSTVTRGGTQRLVINTTRDAEGHATAVSRRSVPDPAGIGTITTQWVYDLAGRKVVEIAPDGMRDSTVYDLAGNVKEQHTRRTDATAQRLVLRMQYDALNRLTQRITPAAQYAARDEGLAARGFIVGWEGGTSSDQPPPYPWYPNDGGTGYLVPADTATFSFDAMGRMVSANNRDARVRRGYYRGGALAGDTLSTRTWAELSAGGNFTSHVYGLQFSYDRNGRRTELKHPANVAPMVAGVIKDRTTFGYDPATGGLARVTDPLGTQFRYHYNARGEVDTLYLPGGMTESYRYDLDGRLARHQTLNGSSSPDRYTPVPLLRNDSIGYDLRGKMLFSYNRAGAVDTLTSQYSPLGHMTYSQARSRGASLNGSVPSSTSTEQPAYDALGNQTSRTTSSTFKLWGYGSTTSSPENFRYQAGTGRLRAKNTPVHGDTLVYDGAGNLVWETYTTPGYNGQDDFRDRAYFYGADDKLRAADTRDVDDPSFQLSTYTRSFEEYRYDALGRRVLVRARRDCQQPPYSALCEMGWVRRTVWDGEHELYEIQAPGGQNLFYGQYLENDTAHINFDPVTTEGNPIDINPFYGRVAYTHGLSLDHPLGVVRMGYGDRLDTANVVRAYRALDPYVIVPHWNSRGQPVLGTYDDGAWRRCQMVSGYKRCNFLSWPEMWAGYARPQVRDNAWHGTLLKDKSDGSGLSYRRNRYYDPASGRFTQEDPIGIAGGVNVYGFAAGDPVNFSDPFGLCPMYLTGRPCGSPLEKRPLSLRGAASGEGNPRIGQFGMTRNGGTRAHHGVDILADVGTPVTAVDEGRVVFAGVAGGYGNTVIVGHTNEDGDVVSYTLYGHLNSIESGVVPGASVESGQTLGAVGQTGNAGGTPPHLHFEIQKQRSPGGGAAGLGKRVDPSTEIDFQE